MIINAEQLQNFVVYMKLFLKGASIGVLIIEAIPIEIFSAILESLNFKASYVTVNAKFSSATELCVILFI